MLTLSYVCIRGNDGEKLKIKSEILTAFTSILGLIEAKYDKDSYTRRVCKFV